MRVRYLVAAGFVGAIAALLLVRHAGYLGGRADGGPLRLGLLGNGASGGARPGQTAGVGGEVMIKGGGDVRVASVESDFASPGLELRGPRVDPSGRCGGCAFPRGARPVIGGTLTAEDRGAVFGLRARRPGVYFAFGLTVDYRQGSRRFRYHDGQTLCLSVGRRNACSLDYALPGEGEGEVAEAGGPSDFGVPIRAGGFSGKPLKVVYPLVAGQRRPAFTLTNLTGHEVSVRDVAIARVESDGLQLEPGRAEPFAFKLAAHEGRRARLAFDLAGCLPSGDAVEPSVSATVDGERATLPMSVGFEFRGSGCP